MFNLGVTFSGLQYFACCCMVKPQANRLFNSDTSRTSPLKIRGSLDQPSLNTFLPTLVSTLLQLSFDFLKVKQGKLTKLLTIAWHYQQLGDIVAADHFDMHCYFTLQDNVHVVARITLPEHGLLCFEFNER